MRQFSINKVFTVGILLVIFVSAITVAVGFKNTGDDFSPKKKLSEYKFFRGELKALEPTEGVYPYDLNSTLFSNYAEKQRFISIPGDKKVSYIEKGVLDFPEGTALIKNFYYPLDFRYPEKGRRIIETRLLVHTVKGWEAYPYNWNEEQTEAFYDVAGETTQVEYINEKGKPVKSAYHIPNKNECKGCHSYNQKMLPIGPTAAELNRSMSPAHGKGNQLLHWKEKGWLINVPDENSIPKMPVWTDVQNASLNDRARAYLDINCSHCHRKGGPAETSGLLLNYDEQDHRSIGINKSPVAAGKGSGGRLYDIVPGKPGESILVYRMQTTEPGTAMPEIGREQVHREAIDLISAWIKNMKSE